MAVLDSSFVIDVMRRKKPALDLRSQLEHEILFIPTPVVMELWEGALKSKVSSEEKAKIEEFLSKTTVLNFDLTAAKRTAEIIVDTSRQPIEAEDAMIAGIALTHGQTVVTRDAHFARIPGLKVLKY